MRKTQEGFTIIELLVVIVIIGILVALALPNLFSAQARGRDTDRKNEVKNLQQKLETYFNDNGNYPAALSNLSPAPTTDEQQGPRGDAYTYSPTGTPATSYTISANLENDDDPDADASGNYVLTSVNQ